jgi:hypothetical protein
LEWAFLVRKHTRAPSFAQNGGVRRALCGRKWRKSMNTVGSSRRAQRLGRLAAS